MFYNAGTALYMSPERITKNH